LIDVVRDDAFAKPLLLPALEREIYEEALAAADYMPRDPTLIYSGQYRPNKGQLDFIRKLDAESLGPFVLELFGYHYAGHNLTHEWHDIQREADSPRLGGRVVVHNGRISHVLMMKKMASASGLVHYSNSDRNPRVLYEALYFGLPLFVSIQSMPYIGLQCHKFVQLADTDESRETMNRRLRDWTDYIVQNEKAKYAVRLKLAQENATGRVGTSKSTGFQSVQKDILTYVGEHLSPQRTFLAFCERFGLCDPSGRFADARTPWVSSGGSRDRCLKDEMWRYENWLKDRWNASKAIKHNLNISKTSDCTLSHPLMNCKTQCLLMNEQDRLTDDKRPWWKPKVQPTAKRQFPRWPWHLSFVHGRAETASNDGSRRRGLLDSE